MKGDFEWMEMVYEAGFSAPLFDLPGRNTELMRSLYQLIHPRFQLRIADLHAFGGNALSDVCVRVTMFGGNGTIEVTAERLSIRFNALKSQHQTVICSECIALAEHALKEALPDAVIATAGIRSTLSLRLGDGSVAGRDFLRQAVTPGVRMDLIGLGNAVQFPCVNLEFRNDDEGWQAVLHAYGNAVEKSSIIASCWMAYLDSQRGHLHKDCISLQQGLLEALLKGLKIKMTSAPAI